MKVKTSLRASLVLALVVCAGCTALGANPPDSPLGYASGGSASSLRAMRSAAGAKIKHVIVIIQENRSFDEMFQGFPGADTQNYGLNHLGKHVPLLQAPLNQRFGLPHGHSTFQLEADYDQSAGHYRMDGFDLVDGCSGKPSCKHSAYTYVRSIAENRAEKSSATTVASQTAMSPGNVALSAASRRSNGNCWSVEKDTT